MCLGLLYLNSCLYELKRNIINKYLMTAVNVTYSHFSSVMFVAMQNGAFYSLKREINQKVGGIYFNLWALATFSFNENISVSLNYSCTSITYETQQKSENICYC